MKLLLVLLGITACCLTPLRAQNTPGNALEPVRVVKSKARPVTRNTAPAKTKARVVYYITNVPATGSHIPVVIRRYQGKNTALFNSQPGSNYSAGDIGLTGALNVGSALYDLDPAISSAGGARGGR